MSDTKNIFNIDSIGRLGRVCIDAILRTWACPAITFVGDNEVYQIDDNTYTFKIMDFSDEYEVTIRKVK